MSGRSFAFVALAQQAQVAANALRPSLDCVAGQAQDCPAPALSTDSLLLQTWRLKGRQGSAEAILGAQRCAVGAGVQCPGSGAWCAGQMCCPGGPGELNFPCPSAPPGWGNGACQTTVKVMDCLQGPPASASEAAAASPTSAVVPTSASSTTSTTATTVAPSSTIIMEARATTSAKTSTSSTTTTTTSALATTSMATLAPTTTPASPTTTAATPSTTTAAPVTTTAAPTTTTAALTTTTAAPSTTVRTATTTRTTTTEAEDDFEGAVADEDDDVESCEVGAGTQCPGTGNWCAGEMCCPGFDGGLNFPCPSARPGWGRGACQTEKKVVDCTSKRARSKEPATPAPATPAPATPAPATPAPAAPALDKTCAKEQQNPWSLGAEAQCCSGLQVCMSDWSGRGEMEPKCLKSCDNAGEDEDIGFMPPAVIDPEVSPEELNVRLMSFNIWHGNSRVKDIAELIAGKVDPDVVNLQEAVNWQPAAIVDELNKRGPGEWKLANEFGWDHFWCGLNAYRSDKWELEWSKEVGYQGSRGICGARLRRKADGTKLCVWGTHPIWFNGGPASSAEEGVRAGAAAMKECAGTGAATAFMCDCNTFDAGAVERQLEKSTGFEWKLAHADGYDQIFVQTEARGGDVGAASFTGETSGGSIAPGAGARGCQAGCQNDQWAGADHPPVYADVVLR